MASRKRATRAMPLALSVPHWMLEHLVLPANPCSPVTPEQLSHPLNCLVIFDLLGRK